MRSLKVQLGTALFCVSTAIGLLSAGISYLSARDEAWRFFDQQLSIVAHNISADSATPLRRDTTSSDQDPEDDLMIQVWDAKGQLQRIWPDHPPLPKPKVAGFFNTRSLVGKWRCYNLVGDKFTTQVCQRFEVRNELAREAAYRSLVPVLLTIPLAWLAIGVIIQRILSRLDDISRELLQLRPRGDLGGSSISIENTPQEIWPFVESVNRALGHSHDALITQRRFIADAAHALRTPLAVLQTQLENLRPANLSQNSKDRIDEMERGLRRAILLVQQMLRMARGEAEERKKSERVDLVALTTASISELVPLVDRHQHDIGLIRSDPASVMADPDDIRMLVDNILDNAIRYTPVGGVIDISIAADADGTSLEIRDTGPGIASDQLRRVLEPFYRATDHRIEGSGLGLSIVAAVAKRCGGYLTLRNRTDRSGLIVRVTFPTLPTAV